MPEDVLEKLRKATPEENAKEADRTLGEYREMHPDDPSFEDNYRGRPFRFLDPLGIVLKKMLDHDPEKRIAAAQALEDPYFSEA